MAPQSNKQSQEKDPPNSYSNSPLNQPDAGLMSLPTFDVLIKKEAKDILPVWVQYSQPEESKTQSD